MKTIKWIEDFISSRIGLVKKASVSIVDDKVNHFVMQNNVQISAEDLGEFKKAIAETDDTKSIQAKFDQFKQARYESAVKKMSQSLFPNQKVGNKLDKPADVFVFAPIAKIPQENRFDNARTASTTNLQDVIAMCEKEHQIKLSADELSAVATLIKKEGLDKVETHQMQKAVYAYVRDLKYSKLGNDVRESNRIHTVSKQADMLDVIQDLKIKLSPKDEAENVRLAPQEYKKDKDPREEEIRKDVTNENATQKDIKKQEKIDRTQGLTSETPDYPIKQAGLTRRASDPSLRPPKRWFGKMKKKVEGDDPGAVIGKIWKDLPTSKKQEIRGREGKTYGPALKDKKSFIFKKAREGKLSLAEEQVKPLELEISPRKRPAFPKAEPIEGVSIALQHHIEKAKELSQSLEDCNVVIDKINAEIEKAEMEARGKVLSKHPEYQPKVQEKKVVGEDLRKVFDNFTQQAKIDIKLGEIRRYDNVLVAHFDEITQKGKSVTDVGRVKKLIEIFGEDEVKRIETATEELKKQLEKIYEVIQIYPASDEAKPMIERLKKKLSFNRSAGIFEKIKDVLKDLFNFNRAFASFSNYIDKLEGLLPEPVEAGLKNKFQKIAKNESVTVDISSVPIPWSDEEQIEFDMRTYTLEDMRDWFFQTRGFPSVLYFGKGKNRVSGEGQSGGRYVFEIVHMVENAFVEKLGIDEYRNRMDVLMEKKAWINSSTIKTAKNGYPNDIDKCRDCAYFNSGTGTTYYKCAECVRAYTEDEFKKLKDNVRELRDYFTDRSVQRSVSQQDFDQKHASLKKKARIDIVDKIMAYEGGEMTDDEAMAFFQELYDSGLWKSLQGGYQRTMNALIDEGLIDTSKKSVSLEGFQEGEEIGYHGRQGTIISKDKGGYIVDFPDTGKQEWIDEDELIEQNAFSKGFSKEARQNTDVIQMFLEDSFPKDKRDVWGTANLKISKQPNGWALVNYSTPLVYRNNEGEVFLNDDKFSVMTSRIQSSIQNIADSLGIRFWVSDTAGIHKEMDKVPSTERQDLSAKEMEVQAGYRTTIKPRAPFLLFVPSLDDLPEDVKKENEGMWFCLGEICETEAQAMKKAKQAGYSKEKIETLKDQNYIGVIGTEPSKNTEVETQEIPYQQVDNPEELKHKADGVTHPYYKAKCPKGDWVTFTATDLIKDYGYVKCPKHGKFKPTSRYPASMEKFIQAEKNKIPKGFSKEEIFSSPEEFQQWLRNGNSTPDYVIVSGILFTMEEYDREGKTIIYGNRKHKKSLSVETSDRYSDNKFGDATVEMYQATTFRNDISYAE